MNDVEISHKLALIIGWKDCTYDPDIIIVTPYYDEQYVAVWFNDNWTKFDYKDPTVIWPIAKKYKTFPGYRHDLKKYSWYDRSLGCCWHVDTAEEAIAMQVIKQFE